MSKAELSELRLMNNSPDKFNLCSACRVPGSR